MSDAPNSLKSAMALDTEGLLLGDVIEPRGAAEIVSLALLAKRELSIHAENLPATAEDLRDLLAASGNLFDRGMPVRIIRAADGGPPLAMPLTRHNVVIEAHRLCQPTKTGLDGKPIPVTLPDRLAQMYLDMRGDWNLAPLAGICTAPLLSADGHLRSAEGYDRQTALWCCNIPAFRLPRCPTRADADASLRLLRQTFQTFPFGDAPRQWDFALSAEVVDINAMPGRDESAFLVALLTAVARPSLWLAPGLLVTAPELSGAGSGKGLLVRAICAIAFGMRPRAFTTGSERQELDKRLAAELTEAQPVLFLDNVNGIALRSDTLASLLTERPARVRLLGQTRMVPLNSTAFVTVTGNGLTVTEDLARRFISCELDAGCEDPESRSFPAGFLDQIEDRRAELLAAVLTIWRWGRQNAILMPQGKPLGSFEQWAKWCRDPLLALGCRDPVERIGTIKANDPRRQRIAELFNSWRDCHGSSPMKASQLAVSVKAIVDPQGRGRQFISTSLSRLVGTRAAGSVLTRQEPAGKWTAATFALIDAASANPLGHRTDRVDGLGGGEPTAQASPMGPMPDAVDSGAVPPGAKAEI
jgi:putative DNA primase/helicase